MECKKSPDCKKAKDNAYIILKFILIQTNRTLGVPVYAVGFGLSVPNLFSYSLKGAVNFTAPFRL